MSHTPARAPGTLWCLSRTDSDTYVRTEINDQILIVGRGINDEHQRLCMSRTDARLLAKRINQCLDETVKR